MQKQKKIGEIKSKTYIKMKNIPIYFLRIIFIDFFCLWNVSVFFVL